MTYGDPRELLEGALNEFPESRDRFEADFAHFCSYSGLLWDSAKPEFAQISEDAFDWARWAFWSAGDYGRKE